MVAQVPLSRGLFALVDLEDLDAVMGAGKWHAVASHESVYARRWFRLPAGGRRAVHMHSFLTGSPLTDHINGDGLDNRRANLREATRSQNGANTRPNRTNTSGFKGVSFQRGRWRAQFRTGEQCYTKGGFATAEEAARAYDAAAIEHFGEFAWLNFPDR